jgi:hypothetical protein
MPHDIPHPAQRNRKACCHVCVQVQRLARLLDSVQEPRFLALPSSTAACDSCCTSVQDAIFGMLMEPVMQVRCGQLRSDLLA